MREQCGLERKTLAFIHRNNEKNKICQSIHGVTEQTTLHALTAWDYSFRTGFICNTPFTLKLLSVRQPRLPARDEYGVLSP